MPMLPKDLRGASRGGGQVPLARAGRRGSLFPSRASQVDPSERSAVRSISRQGSARTAPRSEPTRSIAGSVVGSGNEAWSVTGKLSADGSGVVDDSVSDSSEDSAAGSMSPAGGANTVDVFDRLASVADSQRMRLVDIFRMVRLQCRR